jgi:PIN domain nuclease of toxin-antitoxin system
MKYLLDTNIFIWFALDDPKLPTDYKATIENMDNDIFISAASLWETGIKYSLGKINLRRDLDDLFSSIEDELNLMILPIEKKHIVKTVGLPFHHRDPFDRLIFAQSVVENIEFLYTDRIFNKYREL